MIKINKKYLTIYIFLLILILALTGCSKNPVTDNYGPSWDMMLELPVTEQENKLSDIAGADEFDNMGFTTKEGSIDKIFVIGTEEKPIVKNLSLDLPELIADLGEKISINRNEVPIQTDSGKLFSITLELPDMTFGSTGNILTFEISNIGDNQIDNLTIELWDKNADRSNPLDTIKFSNLSNDSSKNLILNNKVVKEDNLELKVISKQSSGGTDANFKIFGLETITIKKVDNLQVKDASTPDFKDLTVELGVFDKIKTHNGKARLDLAINEPESMNMNFDFKSISIDSIEGQEDGENSDFYWTNNTDSDTEGITLGNVSLDGTVTLPDDNIISYDATDHANVAISIVGKASYDSNDSNDAMTDELEDIKVENGDLIYEAEPVEVKMTQEDIETMREGVIDLEQTYLETIIDNNTGIELAAEIYIGSTNNKTNLYTSANKVNERLLEVTVDENDPKRFLLKNTIDKVEETLTEGNVYMGIKFLAGDLDTDTTDFDFSTNSSLNIKSSVFVKVRVNQ